MTLLREAETDRLQALLDARTEALARRGADRVDAVAMRAFLVCTCGAERYGLPLDGVAQVRPVRRWTVIPGAPAALLGIVALSGRIVSVLGLAEALGRPGADIPESGHLVVLRGGSAPVALAVDRVVGMIEVPDDADRQGAGSAASESGIAGLGEPPVSGYADAEAANFAIVDLPRLLRRYLS